MAGMSDYLEAAVYNSILRNVSFTSPTTVYVALFTADPTDANVGTEVSGTAYVRMAATFSAPTNGVGSNTADIIFPTAAGSWGSITHSGLYDALSGGNLLFHGALGTTKVIDTGDIFKFAAGDLVCTIA